MELDDLKKDWESAIDQTTKHNNLSSIMISKMTKAKYQTKIKKIKYPELIGGIVCIIGFSFIVLNFYKLDTTFLKSIGLLAVLLLLILPILSFLSLKQFNSTNNFNKPYLQILKQFANQKLQFFKYQKVNAFLSYLLLVMVIILLPKFFYDKDLELNKYFWIISFTIGYIFLLFFSKWVNKFYSNSLDQAEDLLKEIENY